MTRSARGLFRATGKAPIVSAARPLLEREALDFYPTPPEPTRALLRAEWVRVSTFRRIWEPACGDGAMMREITALGLDCIGSDLVDRGGPGPLVIRDFFDFTQPLDRAIITNPPYDQINWRDGRGRWVEHAMGTLGVDYMALLLNWSWPGAGGLAGVWHRHPPARVYLCRWKIDFTGAGAPPMLSGWFVWDRTAPPGPPTLHMLDRAGDARQEAML